MNSTAELFLIGLIWNYNKKDFRINNIARGHYATSMFHCVNWWGYRNDYRWQGTTQESSAYNWRTPGGRSVRPSGSCVTAVGTQHQLSAYVEQQQRKPPASFLNCTPAYFLEQSDIPIDNTAWWSSVDKIILNSMLKEIFLSENFHIATQPSTSAQLNLFKIRDSLFCILSYLFLQINCTHWRFLGEYI